MKFEEFEQSPIFSPGLRLLRHSSSEQKRLYLEVIAEYLGMWARFDEVEADKPSPPVNTLNVKANVNRLYQRAIEVSGGNRREAARMLGVDEKTVYNRLKKQA